MNVHHHGPKGRALAALAVVLCAGLCSGVAGAQCVGMPEGAWSYMEMQNSSTPCGEAAVGTLSIPYPSPNYCEPSACPFGRVVLANADNRANRMRMSTHTETGVMPHFYSSMVDTYTVAGPPGSEGTPVTLRVRCHMVGIIYSSFHAIIGGAPAYYQGGSITLEVGTWAPGTNSDFHEQFRVTTFAPEFLASANMPGVLTSSPRVMPVDLWVDQPLTRTVGGTFDIAYGLSSGVGTLGNASGSGSPPDGDFLVTAIGFELPPGYTISSLHGWTDPDAPVCGSADFNGDGDIGTDLDIEAFFGCLAGSCCASCGSVDFNRDGDLGTDGDIESFFRVLGGAAC